MPEDQQLQRLFRTTEELEHEEEAHVNGEIPDYVNGTYVRVGPGKFDLDNGFRMEHWLDGYSILSRFSIEGDRVIFNKKFLQSEAYKRALHAGAPVFCEYGSPAHPDPQKGFFSKLATRFLPFDLTDNDTLSLFQLGKELFASSETSYFRQVNPCTLHSGDRYDTNKFFGLNVCSAHPLTDPDTGITYQLGSTLLTGCKYHFVKIPPISGNQSSKDMLKKSKTLCTIPSSHYGALSFNHSFGMTKNYLIFIEQPYLMHVTKAVASVVKGGQCFKDWLEWRPEHRNRFFLIEKDTGKVLKAEVMADEPFFFLHFINCYEENGQVVVDVNGYPSTQVLDSMHLDRLRNNIFDVDDQPVAMRFAVPVLDTLKGVDEGVNLVEIKTEATAIRQGSQIILTHEQISTGFELPTINQKFGGKKYSYVYATGSVAPGPFQNAVAKIDVRKKEAVVWKPSTSYFPGEPMFVPNPNSSGAEDDGVLISCVSDTTDSNSKDFIVFIDAKSMEELGRARFKAHIPQALHGIFLNSS